MYEQLTEGQMEICDLTVIHSVCRLSKYNEKKSPHDCPFIPLVKYFCI